VKLIKKIGFLVALLYCTGLHAQHEGFRLGFQVTPGFSWMNTNKLSVSSVGTNAIIGLAAHGEFGISEHFSAVAGIGLTFNCGGKLRHVMGGNFFPQSRLSDDAYNTGDKPLPDGTRLKYSLQYLEFPVALKWRSPESKGPLRYYVEVPAVTWAFTLQRRGAIRAGDINTAKEDISKDVNPFNIMVGVGGGTEYTVSPGTIITAGIHYQRGLLDITGDQATVATPNPDDNPFDPTDDYINAAENAKAVLNAFVIRLGILF